MKPILKLVVGSNSEIRIARTQAAKRNPKLVSYVAQKVQQLALPPRGSP